MIFILHSGKILHIKDEDVAKKTVDPLSFIYRKPPTRWQRFIHWLKH